MKKINENLAASLEIQQKFQTLALASETKNQTMQFQK